MLGRQSVAVGRFGFGGAGGGGCRKLCEEGELGGELGVGEGALRLVEEAEGCGEGGGDDGFVDGRRSGEAAGSD